MGAKPLRICNLDLGYDSYAVEEEILGGEDCTLAFFQGERHDREGRIAFARDAQGIFVRWTEVDAAFLDALPRLKYIVRYGIGYDNIDLAAASARGVRVCNVQGYATHAVSDHALALILSCLRGLPLAATSLTTGFNAPPVQPMPELRHLTLGIIGLGRIGGMLARKAHGLFERVLACDPYVPAARFTELGADRVERDEVFAHSHVLSLHCNLTSETHHLLDAAALAQLPPGAIVINTARGPVADETALLAALTSGHVAAAGLDVFESEPPAAGPLLAHPRVFATGHYAWYSESAARELQRRAALNMAAFVRGEVPEDCLNP